MRIISQNGLLDIPYERIIVEGDMNVIRVYDNIRSGYHLMLAEYQSMKEVRAVLDEMRKAYREGKDFFKLP